MTAKPIGASEVLGSFRGAATIDRPGVIGKAQDALRLPTSESQRLAQHMGGERLWKGLEMAAAIEQAQKAPPGAPKTMEQILREAITTAGAAAESSQSERTKRHSDFDQKIAGCEKEITPTSKRGNPEKTNAAEATAAMKELKQFAGGMEMVVGDVDGVIASLFSKDEYKTLDSLVANSTQALADELHSGSTAPAVIERIKNVRELAASFGIAIDNKGKPRDLGDILVDMQKARAFARESVINSAVFSALLPSDMRVSVSEALDVRKKDPAKLTAEQKTLLQVMEFYADGVLESSEMRKQIYGKIDKAPVINTGSNAGELAAARSGMVGSVSESINETVLDAAKSLEKYQSEQVEAELTKASEQLSKDLIANWWQSEAMSPEKRNLGKRKFHTNEAVVRRDVLTMLYSGDTTMDPKDRITLGMKNIMAQRLGIASYDQLPPEKKKVVDDVYAKDGSSMERAFFSATLNADLKLKKNEAAELLRIGDAHITELFANPQLLESSFGEVNKHWKRLIERSKTNGRIIDKRLKWALMLAAFAAGGLMAPLLIQAITAGVGMLPSLNQMGEMLGQGVERVGGYTNVSANLGATVVAGGAAAYGVSKIPQYTK